MVNNKFGTIICFFSVLLDDATKRWRDYHVFPLLHNSQAMGLNSSKSLSRTDLDGDRIQGMRLMLKVCGQDFI